MLMSAEFDTAVDIVASRWGIEPDVLINSGQSPRYVSARRTVYLVLNRLDWSLHEIGREFGKCHTTVWHHIHNVHPMETAFAERVVAFLNEQRAEVERRGLDG